MDILVPEIITLFRPVGKKEMELIKKSNYCAFPPRLPFQPFFYPVLNEEYAVQIARDWNTKDAESGYIGYVTQFQLRAEFIKRYSVKAVGDSHHKEYWIPAQELSEFNQNIIGKIKVINKFIDS
ncbi:hypothetical protein [Okeania sp. SIO2B3]|uniref:hypothetical protein n=1 Tax=Okeania sp. SIO2B3 TaxID=2607784 RepID=UPI0013BFCEA2|nr:hypothetical protein [Okeania sp. SIO2B3]NET46271.1 hypothetical protein [Okeania sp. SIO2B3]